MLEDVVTALKEYVELDFSSYQSPNIRICCVSNMFGSAVMTLYDKVLVWASGDDVKVWVAIGEINMPTWYRGALLPICKGNSKLIDVTGEEGPWDGVFGRMADEIFEVTGRKRIALIESAAATELMLETQRQRDLEDARKAFGP